MAETFDLVQQRRRVNELFVQLFLNDEALVFQPKQHFGIFNVLKAKRRAADHVVFADADARPVEISGQFRELIVAFDHLLPHRLQDRTGRKPQAGGEKAIARLKMHIEPADVLFGAGAGENAAHPCVVGTLVLGKTDVPVDAKQRCLAFSAQRNARLFHALIGALQQGDKRIEQLIVINRAVFLKPLTALVKAQGLQERQSLFAKSRKSVAHCLLLRKRARSSRALKTSQILIGLEAVRLLPCRPWRCLFLPAAFSTRRTGTFRG